MASDSLRIETDRLVLRSWTDADKDVFAELNADPIVMADQGGPISRRQSDAKLDRYMQAFDEFGYGRLAVERKHHEPGESEFVGYVGVMPVRTDHSLGQHDEVGWRLVRSAWGHGYASEAARASLVDAFGRVDLAEIFSYTAPDNHRSQAVMTRIGLRRDAGRDFDFAYEGVGDWRGLVWVAERAAFLDPTA